VADPRRSRDRRPPQARRAQLLAAATAAIAAHGFDGVTVRDVAREAGVSPGLLHHYFDSFEELVAAAFAASVQAGIERLTAEVAARSDPRDRLDRLIAVYAPTAGDREWLLWLSAWGAAPRQPALRVTADRLHTVWTDQFRSVLEEGVAAGAFRCPDPAAAARRLVSLLDGFGTQVVALEVLAPAQIATDLTLAVARETGLDPADFPGIAAVGAGG
jgi:AcrR family transcriptional regulator